MAKFKKTDRKTQTTVATGRTSGFHQSTARRDTIRRRDVKVKVERVKIKTEKTEDDDDTFCEIIEKRKPRKLPPMNEIIVIDERAPVKTERPMKDITLTQMFPREESVSLESKFFILYI